VSCTVVRDRLAERALGVLDRSELQFVDRHIAWCAACRRESEGLHGAASSLAFAPASVEPAPELEERVLAVVRREVTAGRADSPRRGRLAVAAVLAAMLALSGLGWGAVMAGRAARLEERVRQAEQRQIESIDKVQTIFENLEFADGRASAGPLSAAGGGIEGGAGMTVTSGSIRDVVIVLVSGLAADGLPFGVELADQHGSVLEVGRIKRLDIDGGATLIQRFDEDLDGFRRLVVRDATGAIVLHGVLDSDAGLASPTPSPAPAPGQ
jgi:hypothetical protein